MRNALKLEPTRPLNAAQGASSVIAQVRKPQTAPQVVAGGSNGQASCERVRMLLPLERLQVAHYARLDNACTPTNII
jgi:hypothetical protein